MQARTLKTANHARDFIATMKRETRSKAARIRMAELAVAVGRYDDSARVVWQDYLTTERGAA